MQMKQVLLVGYRSDRKAILEQLQRLGVMDIRSARREDEQVEGFLREDTRQQAASFERAAASLAQAVAVLNEIQPEKKGVLGMLNGRREIGMDRFEACAAEAGKQLEEAYGILALHKRKAECQGEIQRLTALLAQLEPWQTMDVPFSFTGTRRTAAFIGSFPSAGTEADWTAALAEKLPEGTPFQITVYSSSPEQSCVTVLCLRQDEQAVELALRGLAFAKPPLLSADLPTQAARERTEKQQALRDEITQIDAQLAEKTVLREALQETADYYTVRAEKYRMIGELWQTRHTFAAYGYVPAQDVPRLQRELCEKLPVLMDVQDADPAEAPVKLKNNGFTAPAASLTRMYALPGPDDIDPTPVMSFFYYLMFGMMFSDAGYGLLMVIACALALKFTRPEEGMRQNMKLFLYCGISTTIWGFLFGGFFGDAIAVISGNFFGRQITLQPLLLNPMKEPVTLLLMSFGIGMVQILVGLGCRFYNTWRHGDRWGAVFDTGFWMTMLIGLSILAIGMATSPAVLYIGAGIAIASAVGLVLTQGRKNKGAMKVVGGLASLYNSTGYLSDLMSYSRLMALGLTTGVLAQVFNMIGAMFGKGLVGALIMIPVFFIGHAINFGLNVLGTYVHTLRLQYVELFSKFYEGGGRPFEPFAFHSKYTRIKEENKS